MWQNVPLDARGGHVAVTGFLSSSNGRCLGCEVRSGSSHVCLGGGVAAARWRRGLAFGPVKGLLAGCRAASTRSGKRQTRTVSGCRARQQARAALFGPLPTCRRSAPVLQSTRKLRQVGNLLQASSPCFGGRRSGSGTPLNLPSSFQQVWRHPPTPVWKGRKEDEASA